MQTYPACLHGNPVKRVAVCGNHSKWSPLSGTYVLKVWRHSNALLPIHNCLLWTTVIVRFAPLSVRLTTALMRLEVVRGRDWSNPPDYGRPTGESPEALFGVPVPATRPGDDASQARGVVPTVVEVRRSAPTGKLECLRMLPRRVKRCSAATRPIVDTQLPLRTAALECAEGPLQGPTSTRRRQAMARPELDGRQRGEEGSEFLPLHSPPVTVHSGEASHARSSGHAHSADDEPELQLRLPKEPGGRGGGTNPEQLVAAGYVMPRVSSAH